MSPHCGRIMALSTSMLSANSIIGVFAMSLSVSRSAFILMGLATAALTPVTQAAVLPAHEPLSVLIVADEVNPHQLRDELLTQPEDLAPALSAADSPLHTSALLTVDSQCIDEALSLMDSSNAPDVMLYFAHRAARHCDGSDAQPRFTSAVEKGLERGMGVVVLHHGLYIDFTAPGAKDDLLALLGARSNSIAWDTEAGQRVIVVGGAHFVTSNGLAHVLSAAETTEFAGTETVPAGTYPVFVNVPDELYEDTVLVSSDGEQRDALFASDSGESRLLGYALSRPGWQSCVVAYQPGEYQPQALDKRTGPNYQILVNALWFAGRGCPDIPADQD